MKFEFNTEEELKNFIHDNVYNSTEAREYLGITRSRLSKLISDEKITPIKKFEKDSLFLKSDLEEKKVELEELRKKYRPYD